MKPIWLIARRELGATLRSPAATSGMALLRQSRLSVSPVTEREFRAVLKLGETSLRG